MFLSLFLVCVLAVGDLGQTFNTLGFVTLGGNVRWHKSEASVKAFTSSLQVHLYRIPPVGSQSEPTLLQRAPILPNGAYSIAVSDNGMYRLKLAVPKGWNFIPKDGFDVKIDASHNNGKNYAFELTGFDVSGQVVTTGMTTGPPNLIVSILSGSMAPSESGIVIGRAKTMIDGSFFLSSVSPGNYMVVVSNTESISGPEDVRASSEISVSTNSIKMEKPLVLQGHILRSKVSFAGVGIANIPIVLFIQKNSKLTLADLSIFGCSKISPTAKFQIPVELKDKVSSKPVCQTISDTEGIFSFSRLAGGDYFLVAYHDASLTPMIKSRLTISPAFLTVQMEHTDLHMIQGFQVTSFHLTGGQVQLISKTPVVGAEVLVNSVYMTKTDNNGAYELELPKPGSYKIDVRVPRQHFSTAVVNLTPKSEQLPHFIPSATELCGQFKFAVSSNLRAKDLPEIEFVTENKVTTSVVASLSQDSASARFCIYLSPGKHSVRLTKSVGVRFAPTSVKIDLSAGPVKEVLFTQFQAKLTGEVICSQKCPITTTGPQLAVRLIPIDNSTSDNVHLKNFHLKADPKKMQRATFTIDSVFPGSYTIELVTTVGESSLVSPASGWCWSGASWWHSVEVIDQDLHYSTTPSLRFEQSGHRLRIEAPLLYTNFGRPIDLTVTGGSSINSADEKAKKTPELKLHFRLMRPVSEICLPKEADTFDVVAETECVRLSPPKPNRLHPDTDIPISAVSPFILQLNVREIPVEAVVEMSSEFASLTKDTTLPQLTVEASIIPFGSQVATPTKRLPASWQKQKLRTSLWVAPGDEVRFVVKPSSTATQLDKVYPLILPTSTHVLHAPSQLSLTSKNLQPDEVKATLVVPKETSETTCSTSLDMAFNSQLSATFTMKPGFFFTGSIVSAPPVSKVLVSVFANPTRVSSALESDIDLSSFTNPEEVPAADFTLITRVLTNERGQFRVGPVYIEPALKTDILSTPASLLTLRLQKPGYEFTQKQPSPGSEWTFTARKLALVELKVVTEDNKPLQNTLITIIGNTFRGSEATDANGIVRYVGLPPDEYYIQPILKEYEFLVRQDNKFSAPMEYALSVIDGESLNVELVGKRVSYSAYGMVASLSSVAEPDVLVEAKLVSGEAGNLKTYPETVPANVGVCRHIQDTNFPVPVEQALTDSSGRFKLLGLLPGCLYAVSVHSRLGKHEQDETVSLRSIPGQIVIRASLEDVSGFHFFVTPPVTIGQISASIDTTDENLLSLSLVVYPVNQPNTVIVRHKFATESRLFSLTGKQMVSMLGNTYTVALETNFQLGSHDHYSTIQQFNFKVQPNGSNHCFKFVHRPHLDYTSITSRI